MILLSRPSSYSCMYFLDVDRPCTPPLILTFLLRTESGGNFSLKLGGQSILAPVSCKSSRAWWEKHCEIKQHLLAILFHLGPLYKIDLEASFYARKREEFSKERNRTLKVRNVLVTRTNKQRV